MKAPKIYSCGNGEGMFEDDKNGHWVEYSEHKDIVEALTEQLHQPAIVGQNEQLICPCCGSDKTYKTDAIHCNRCAVTTEI